MVTRGFSTHPIDGGYIDKAIVATAGMPWGGGGMLACVRAGGVEFDVDVEDLTCGTTKCREAQVDGIRGEGTA